MRDLQLKSEGTIANEFTKNFEFRGMKANFVKRNCRFCFLGHVVFPNVGFPITFKIIKGVDSKSFSNVSYTV